MLTKELMRDKIKTTKSGSYICRPGGYMKRFINSAAAVLLTVAMLCSTLSLARVVQLS